MNANENSSLRPPMWTKRPFPAAQFAQGHRRLASRHPIADARDLAGRHPTGFGGEKNPPIFVTTAPAPTPTRPQRSTSAPGLPALRAGWIEERGDDRGARRPVERVRPPARRRHRAR